MTNFISINLTGKNVGFICMIFYNTKQFNSIIRSRMTFEYISQLNLFSWPTNPHCFVDNVCEYQMIFKYAIH